MPRRKTTRISKPRKKATRLRKVFSCLLCERDDVVRIEMQRKKKNKKTVREGIGKLECTACHGKFEHPINHLSAEVNVFGAWVDSLEANKKAKEAEAMPGN